MSSAVWIIIAFLIGSAILIIGVIYEGTHVGFEEVKENKPRNKKDDMRKLIFKLVQANEITIEVAHKLLNQLEK